MYAAVALYPLLEITIVSIYTHGIAIIETVQTESVPRNTFIMLSGAAEHCPLLEFVTVMAPLDLTIKRLVAMRGKSINPNKMVINSGGASTPWDKWRGGEASALRR